MIRAVCALLLFTSVGAADPIRFVVRPRNAAIPPRLVLTVQQVSSLGEVQSDGPVHTIDVPRDGATSTLELAPGYWSLDVTGDDVWHQRQYLAHDAGEVIVDLWRGSTLQGTFETNDDEPPPSITAQFSSADESQPSGQSDCSLAKNAFRCRTPAGNYAIRLRARGYVAHLLPQTNGASIINAGAIRFQRGQSILGRIQLGRNTDGDVRKATVSARPRNTPQKAVLETKPSRNGSFQLDAATPGEYVLKATAPGQLSSEEMIVRVITGADAELARPLVLDRPRRLSVTIAPNVAPEGSRWSVTVSRHISQTHLDTVTSSDASVDGTWSAFLQPARYLLEIGSAGSQWFSEEIDVNAEDVAIPVTLSTRTLRGRVLLGNRPLQGSIELSSPAGSIRAEVDADGAFSMVMPVAPNATWSAHINAAVPPVDRTVAVTLPEDDDDVMIRLPNASLHGVVVDAEGKPVRSAIVSVTSGEAELMQLSAEADGSFAAHGLTTGTYSAQADAGFLQSEWTTVTIDTQEQSADIRLVAQPVREVRGRVVSAFGPVAGADVSVRATNVGGVAFSRTTDARGEFRFLLAPDAEELDVRVAPPGFAYTIGHVRWEKNTPLLVTVDQRGGTLTVRGREDANLILRHEGATEWVSSLRGRWPTISSDDGAIVIESMEPGVYQLCDGSRCVEGFLPPFGDATLSLR